FTDSAVAPALSPDGRVLAFFRSDRWWLTEDQICVKLLPFLPFWSPDKRFVAFSAVVGGASGSLKKIDISGGPAQTICYLPTGLVTGSWNQDGVILFGNTTGPLHRVSADDEAPQPVTKLNTSRRELGHLWPHFLPDG